MLSLNNVLEPPVDLWYHHVGVTQVVQLCCYAQSWGMDRCVHGHEIMCSEEREVRASNQQMEQ